MSQASIRATLAADPAVGAGNALGALIEYGAPLNTPTLAFDTEVDGHPAWCSLTLGTLYQRVLARAAWLHGHGVRPRDPVAVYTTDAADVVLGFLALARLGAIPALVNGNLDGATAAAYIGRLDATAVLADREHRERLAGRVPELARFDVEAVGSGRTQDAPPAYRHHADDPIAITHSSGTTGAPKPITATHASQFAAVRYRLRRPRAQGSDRSLSALPVPHNATLSILNFSLGSASELLVLSRQDGPYTLDAIRRWRPGTVLGFPVTWAELARMDLPPDELDSVRLWWNVGDCAHEAHIRRLIASGRRRVATAHGLRWTDGSVFADNFGSSELGHTVLSIRHHPGTERFGRCVGRPEPYAEAVVLGPTGERLPPGEHGLLGVRSPSMSPGYWNDSTATYRSRLAGWVLTGDVVYQDEDGYFYHLDRSTDAVSTPDGTGLYTAVIEECVLASCPDVLDCTAVASVHDGRPVVEVLLRLTTDADRTADRTAAVRAVLDHGVASALRRVVVVDDAEIPFGATGKVRKRMLRERMTGMVG
ncbi:class I adenylate-forming enzyme family protein [Actinophytocola sp.]|uniref:class I adenylate-forming enzyme family protein n=1 Tax=Actinophytocola sp. TaxID=1872138 RepID=UPI003D6B50C0